MEEKIVKAINDQINAEFYSFQLYLSISAYFEVINFKGMAHWMGLQAKEEMNHAMNLFYYLNQRGAKVVLDSIDKPPASWESPLDAFQSAYDHELLITKRINNIVDIAEEAKDRATFNFLQWFVSEQVEEEAAANDVVQKLKMVGDSIQGLFFVDSFLGKRVLHSGSPDPAQTK